jgi:hypothetical protein
MSAAATDERLREARLWAAEQKCVLDLDGEVGFGRECVGVLYKSSYVDTPGSGSNDWPEYPEAPDERRMPPEDVDAYHKHDCLCVLGRDETAVDGLLRWVEKIREHGGRVVVRPRERDPHEGMIGLLLHGTETATIEFD